MLGLKLNHVSKRGHWSVLCYIWRYSPCTSQHVLTHWCKWQRFSKQFLQLPSCNFAKMWLNKLSIVSWKMIFEFNMSLYIQWFYTRSNLCEVLGNILCMEYLTNMSWIRNIPGELGQCLTCFLSQMIEYACQWALVTKKDFSQLWHINVKNYTIVNTTLVFIK